MVHAISCTQRIYKQPTLSSSASTTPAPTLCLHPSICRRWPRQRPVLTGASGQPLSVDDNDQDSVRVLAKSRLRQLISKINAAALPGPVDLASLHCTLQQLYGLNPSPDTATSDLINGRWVLLYTASLSSLQRAVAAAAAAASSSSTSALSPTSGSRSHATGSRGSGAAAAAGGHGTGSAADSRAGRDGSAVTSPLQAANDMAYRFFYNFVPVLAGAAVGTRGASSTAGLVQARGNFQVVDTRAGRLENQARFDVSGRQCCIHVNGEAEVVQAAPGQPRQRLQAVFTSFDLAVDGERRLSLPLSLLNPVGYVDTPYLDEELRISIGDKGSVFIAARDSSSSSGSN